ncbi:hypothetical protein CLOM_g16472 [Closterium sp. NIES-68]|nr:hypothetical protein CLOM_g16472 [Closterium sp. NIES-68]GJP58201.1 hypothetical protein CLOP_g22672 [Closterium sp. NIES-67]
MSGRFSVFSSVRKFHEGRKSITANSIDPLTRSGAYTASSPAFFATKKGFSSEAAPKNSLPGPRSTPLFRVLNPELYVKPNAAVALVGTVAFVGVLGSLYLEKRAVEKQRAEAKAAAEAALVASGRTIP